MKNICYVFYILFTCCVYNVICDIAISPVNIVENAPNYVPVAQMDTIVYKTVNKYFCTVKNFHLAGNNLILFGTNGWTFPTQDVNLTLRYPTYKENELQFEQYIITGFEVILSMDGNGSDGFITEGGIMEESLTLMFTSRSISRMKYEFWVYGFRKDLNMTSHTNHWTAHKTICP